MVSSRTGTALWKKISAEAIRLALAEQQFTCPLCGVFLDYTRSRQPNSPEADHIIPHAAGGEDILENLRIICRRCNQRLGGKYGRSKQLAKASQRIEPKRATTTVQW